MLNKKNIVVNFLKKYWIAPFMVIMISILNVLFNNGNISSKLFVEFGIVAIAVIFVLYRMDFEEDI